MDTGYLGSDSSFSDPLPKVVSPTTVLPPAPSSQERKSGGTFAGELDRLRDILYGNQARSTDRRLGDVEGQIEALRRNLTELFHEKVDNLEKTAGSDLASANSALSKRLDGQSHEQAAALRMVQQTLSERLDQQELDQVKELRTIQKEVNERLETLSVDMLNNLRDIQRDLSERIEQISQEQGDRLRQLQNDSRQRNNSLRQELLMLAASLEDNKISRHELGHMLQELGQRLRSDQYLG